jgi:flagellar motor switch protein FliG
LEEASAIELARYLEREHPQTIAVVVSHLPPERGADVLASLPASLQAAVARRLVDLEAADPEVVREVERGLQSWLAEQVKSRARRKAGLATLEGILQAADNRTQHELLSNLENYDEQLVRKLSPPRRQLPTMAELEQWDDSALVLLLERTDAEVMTLALAGSSASLVERVLGCLPRARAKALRHAIQHLGPTPLSDLEAAQTALAEMAYDLQLRGEVTGATSRHVSLAA